MWNNGSDNVRSLENIVLFLNLTQAKCDFCSFLLLRRSTQLRILDLISSVPIDWLFTQCTMREHIFTLEKQNSISLIASIIIFIIVVHTFRSVFKIQKSLFFGTQFPSNLTIYKCYPNWYTGEMQSFQCHYYCLWSDVFMCLVSFLNHLYFFSTDYFLALQTI